MGARMFLTEVDAVPVSGGSLHPWNPPDESALAFISAAVAGTDPCRAPF